jgi:hypothetical protein
MYKIYKSNAMVHKNHNHDKQNNVSQQLKLQPRNTKLPDKFRNPIDKSWQETKSISLTQIHDHAIF